MVGSAHNIQHPHFPEIISYPLCIQNQTRNIDDIGFHGRLKGKRDSTMKLVIYRT